MSITVDVSIVRLQEGDQARDIDSESVFHLPPVSIASRQDIQRTIRVPLAPTGRMTTRLYTLRFAVRSSAKGDPAWTNTGWEDREIRLTGQEPVRADPLDDPWMHAADVARPLPSRMAMGVVAFFGAVCIQGTVAILTHARPSSPAANAPLRAGVARDTRAMPQPPRFRGPSLRASPTIRQASSPTPTPPTLPAAYPPPTQPAPTPGPIVTHHAGNSMLMVSTHTLTMSHGSQGTVNLVNLGPRPLHIGRAILVGPGADAFAIVRSCASRTLAVYAGCTISIRVRGQKAGTAFLVMVDDAATGGQDIALHSDPR